MIVRKVCETEALNIQIQNKRGGFNANIDLGNSNVNVVKRKPDENFEFNAVLEGIIDNPDLFISNESVLQIANRTENELLLAWNQDLFTRPHLRKCLNSAELIDEQGSRTFLDITKDVVAIDKDLCQDRNFTVKYKYGGKTFETRKIEIPEKLNCFDIKPSNVKNKETDDEETSASATVIGLVVLLLIVILGVVLALFVYKRKLGNQGGYQLEVSSGTDRGGEGIVASQGAINVAMGEDEIQNQNNES